MAVSTVMVPWNGSDGAFNTIILDGNTIYQGADDGSGNYAGFQYYRRPSGVNFAPGATLYLEVDYKDLGGPGRIGCQYNAVSADFQGAGMVLGSSVQDTGGYKTGVMRLDAASFRLAQNGGNDLRLTRTQNLRFHIKEVRVSDTPSAAYLAQTAYMGPYTGPAYAGGTPVDASTFDGKMYVGYQGWFRTPADDDDVGWQHWTRSWGSMAAGLISEDFWPQMDEFTAAEKHAASGYTYPNGSQAELFSSDNARTVLRHFQWMEAYGIDGAAVQRFTNGLGSPGSDGYRVISHVRAAANQTGRVYYIEYDMTGTQEADLVNFIANDWHTLVDSLQLPADGRYLKHGGLPVVGVFGFFPERFSPATANAILDIFQNGLAKYRAFVAGAGAWYWRTAAETTPAWQSMLYRLGAWQPWNCGNFLGPYPNYVAKTDYWAADKADFNAHGVIYQPELYPGASSANRDGLPPSTPDMPRQGGDFLWKQFVEAYNLGFQTVFLGMFDELDEGTQIIKVTEAWPTQGSFKAYEGQASDCYLCYAGLGAKMLKGQLAYSASKPDCAARTQPSIPDAIAPLNGSATSGLNASYSWTAALALPGGGSLSRYEVWLDGSVINVGLASAASLPTAAGSHVWRVRAVNSLGVAGGWSVAQSFTHSGGSTPSPTTTRTTTFTASPTPSPTPSLTPFVVGACGIQAEDYTAAYDATAGNSGGQYRTDDVDIEACGDLGGGYNVGWTDAGEWLEYWISVPNGGLYDVGVRSASNNASGASLRFSLDGSDLGGPLTLPGTGGWQSYQDATLSDQSLPGGLHRLRMTLLTGGSNLNYLCIRPAATPTPTASVSRTPSRSPTLTPTRTGTPTRTPTASPTAASTGTPSATPSLSPSRTPTVSPSPSPLSSATPSASAISSPSPSPSLTPTPAGSATPTATPSVSGISSPSASASATRTPASSATASATPSASDVVSASVTASGTLTPAISASASSTRSVTAAVSPSPSPSATGVTQISPTPSATASTTGPPTASRTMTPSPSASATRSATPSPTRSATLTASPTATGSASSTPSRSPSPALSATPSPALPTVTPALSASPSPTLLATLAPSATPSQVPTIDLGGRAVDEAARILELRPFPHPSPRWLGLHVRGHARVLRVRIYSASLGLVEAEGAQDQGPGWVRIPVGRREALAPGTYFYVADLGDGDPHPIKGALIQLPCASGFCP